jgi:AmmeMemoRadiSam system protein A
MNHIKKSENSFSLEANDKKVLLELARTTIETYTTSKEVIELNPANYSKTLKTDCGAFVTLNKNHQLRGCIGRFDASEPLYLIVQQMAIAAATQDSRFLPVNKGELKDLEIEISVLSPMRKINSVDEIILGKHGIYIVKGSRNGTFLPQVATETGWTLEEFLGHCSRDKAGLGWDGWKEADIYVYEAIVFSESELK